ncbi:MAG TPA: class I SAM-dependent methyltransferase [Pseudomonadales bacterium]|jgi:ubiquinone/menaquinone biosynthesis C-methylase UbiE|nr:class I SAM-dependent methyltransferase [Pseudomonadales bacterium]
MGLYSHYILPKLINSACAMPQMMALRKRYVPLAKGRVLEIGIGSGLNLEFYSDATDSVTGLDPATELTEIAHQRAMKLGAVVELLTVSGETIPADTESFDTIVCTWTLCSIPNVYRALDEMRRVLKKDGRLIFIEHGRAPDPWVARVQNGLEPVWKRIGGGCHLTREPDALLNASGFTFDQLEEGYEPGPRFAAYMYHGIARPR